MMIAHAVNHDRTVLLVDRGRQSGTVLRDALKHKGYTVELAQDLERGFERALAGGIDLVVLHQRAFDEGSANWCRRLVALNRGPYVPVIMIAERVPREQPLAGLTAGVAAHLSSPLDAHELLYHVRIWTEARERLRAFYERLLRAVEVAPEANCA
jgi:two-component system response regulator ArlR